MGPGGRVCGPNTPGVKRCLTAEKAPFFLRMERHDTFVGSFEWHKKYVSYMWYYSCCRELKKEHEYKRN